MMDNFDNIPSNGLRVEVTRLVNTLNSNAGLYDTDNILAALCALRWEVRKSSQKELRRIHIKKRTYNGIPK